MPTDDPTPLWAVTSAIKDGLSGRAGLREFRAAGGKIRDSTWFKLYGEVSRSLAEQPAEVAAPLDRKPLRAEITTWTVQQSNRNYAQFVDVYAHDKETGTIVRHPYQIATDDLMTRADVIATAIDRFSAAAEAYGEQILGAAYVSTYEFVQV